MRRWLSRRVRQIRAEEGSFYIYGIMMMATAAILVLVFSSYAHLVGVRATITHNLSQELAWAAQDVNPVSLYNQQAHQINLLDNGQSALPTAIDTLAKEWNLQCSAPSGSGGRYTASCTPNAGSLVWAGPVTITLQIFQNNQVPTTFYPGGATATANGGYKVYNPGIAAVVQGPVSAFNQGPGSVSVPFRVYALQDENVWYVKGSNQGVWCHPYSGGNDNFGCAGYPTAPPQPQPNPQPNPQTPQVTGVSFSGSGQNTTITITGSGFGQAPQALPYNGDLSDFAFNTSLWQAGTGSNAVTLNYTSWSSTQIVINGFGDQYGQGPSYQDNWQLVPNGAYWVTVTNPQSGQSTQYDGTLPSTV